MTDLVADTSSLVSLGHAADQDPDPVGLLGATYEVTVPQTVVDELREIASYSDPAAQAAQAVLDDGQMAVTSVTLDAAFPLDDGENAAVTLANDIDAALLLCDEFNSLGLVHASLTGPRLVTTPTLLITFVKQGHLSPAEGRQLLSALRVARSWSNNEYVERAQAVLDDL